MVPARSPLDFPLSAGNLLGEALAFFVGFVQQLPEVLHALAAEELCAGATYFSDRIM